MNIKFALNEYAAIKRAFPETEITGSVAFGKADPNDLDLMIPYSKEAISFLQSRGYDLLSKSESEYADRGTALVLRHSNGVDVQLIFTHYWEKKLKAQHLLIALKYFLDLSNHTPRECSVIWDIVMSFMTCEHQQDCPVDQHEQRSNRL